MAIDLEILIFKAILRIGLFNITTSVVANIYSGI